MQDISNRLTGKIVLIAGGATVHGRGIVHYFLKANATVIVPGTSLQGLNGLKASIENINTGHLITHLTELPDYDKAFDIAETIVEEFGKIDIGIGVFSNAPCSSMLTEAHINDWQQMIDTEVTPFFVCARLILNAMKLIEDGLYVNVCYGKDFEDGNYAPLSKIAQNAKMEMSKIFAEESKKHNVRYQHLWVKPTDDGDNNLANLNSAETIGTEILKLFIEKTENTDCIFHSIPENAGA
ncbi:SDR family NAD(P)-dependent oxidoreductase [Parasediminibacterium sp. JCM 36343]|uniref:SDR family NAD(P)-dependent oxidoreductase n=1 Tax=Parasediminibacterium sp. JCM 36343 TaxID=3374279 RepID=UPI00397DD671